MPFNGSGVFSLSQPAFSNGTVADATAVNSDLSDIATGLTNTLTKDGQSTPTADIKLGGFKLTGVGAAAALGDALSYGRAATVTSLTMSGALAGITDLTTTGNTILGDATTDTLNVGNGGIVKSAAGLTTIAAPNGSAAAALTVNGGTTAGDRGLDIRGGTGAGDFCAIFRNASGATNLLTIAGDGGVNFTPSGTSRLTLDTGGNLVPGVTNAQTLGSAGIRWSTVSSVLGNFSGLVTASAGINTGSADNTALGVAISRSKTATTSRSLTTTLADDPHLVVPLSVGTWGIQMSIPIWATTGGAGGVKVGVAFSGTKTSAYLASTGSLNGTVIDTGTVDLVGGAGAAQFNNATISIQSGVVGADYLFVSGSITVTVAGNLSLQWAQNSSSANACNVGVGGWLSCTKVA